LWQFGGLRRVKHIFRYQSGEEIKAGDHVLFHGNAAEIEFVACDADDPRTDWYVTTYGGGVMIYDPQVSGRTFVAAEHIASYEDLEFIRRAERGSN
jgi:hypothetical protein